MPSGRVFSGLVKSCETCEEEFKVPQCRSEARFCSPKCSQVGLRGKPRNYSPESRAKLGRPRASKDTERTCPICETVFVLPEWNPKIYCSNPCSYASRAGRKHTRTRIEKTCPICEVKFEVSPSGRAQRYCSHICAGAGRSFATAEQIREMTEPEIAWLAGIMDGEGSITLPKRQQNPYSKVCRMFVTNTHRPLIDRVAEVTGVGSITCVKRSLKNPRHKDVYTWTVTGYTAIQLAKLMRPWLLARAERADAILEGRPFLRQDRWDYVFPDMPDPVVALIAEEAESRHKAADSVEIGWRESEQTAMF